MYELCLIQVFYIPNLQTLKLSDVPASLVNILCEEPCLNLTSLYLDLPQVDSCCTIDAINKGLTPNLNSLVIERRNAWSKAYLNTTSISLIKCTQLKKLNIRESLGITGNLSALLRHTFPSLNSLILRRCGLNSQDLCSLAQASVEGRIPQLRDLDISENRDICLDDMFQASCIWNQLLRLNITGIYRFTKQNITGISFSEQLRKAMSSDVFNSLQEVSISDDQISSYKLQNLQKISLSKDLLVKLPKRLVKVGVPNLDTVWDRYRCQEDLCKEPALYTLLEKKICVRDYRGSIVTSSRQLNVLPVRQPDSERTINEIFV